MDEDARVFVRNRQQRPVQHDQTPPDKRGGVRLIAGRITQTFRIPKLDGLPPELNEL